MRRPQLVGFVGFVAASAAAGIAFAGGGHRVRAVGQLDVPQCYFGAMTTDVLGRPIYTCRHGLIVAGDFQPEPLVGVSVVRHLDGRWHLLDRPLDSQEPYRFVPALGLVDEANVVEPGRYAPIAIEGAGAMTDLVGNPLVVTEVVNQPAMRSWFTKDGLVSATDTTFVDEAGDVIARFEEGAIVVADWDGHLFAGSRVHFPGDGPDTWAELTMPSDEEQFGPLSNYLYDGSGHVWLAAKSPVGPIAGGQRIYDIVFD